MTKQQQSNSLVNLVVNKANITPIMLTELASELMPKGEPNFKAIAQYTPIQKMLDLGLASRTDLREILTILVMNFSESLNVVRNLNATQAVEIVEMLIEECGDEKSGFRVEDYFLMFQLAKRGEIGDIRDRIDIQLISKLLDEYWHFRYKEGKRLREELEKEMAAKRQEQKRKALGSGEQTEQVMTAYQFNLELQKLQAAMIANLDKQTLDEAKQNQIKKEMLYNRMKELYGFSDEQMEKTENIRIQTFGSKINDE